MLYISLKARLLHNSVFPPKYSREKKKQQSKQQDNPQQTETVMTKLAAFSIQVLT